MVILVAGLGSMGRRRIRLINQYNGEYEILGVDLNAERRVQAENQFHIKTYDSLQYVLEARKVDCIFISTAPLSHFSIIKTCLENNIHVFTELNLVAAEYDSNIALAKKNKCVLFLSSTFLYREEVQFIQTKVKEYDKKLNYIYHIGQYLPDWHPWENYRQFFAGNKQTNGCREILAIELPWLIRTFGMIKNIMVAKDNITDLDIDYMDNYLILLEHESGHKGSLAVDIVSRKSVRNMEIYGEEFDISWNGSPEGLYQLDLKSKENIQINLYKNIDKLNEYNAQVIENAYYNEVVNFFEVLKGSGKPRYTFEEDKIVLSVIDDIEAR